jgi:polyhydroxyalkanoate synthesis regulator phasin
VNDEIERLRARVDELERRVAVLFEQTGTADWALAAEAAPPVSEEVRLLVAEGKTREAAKRYMRETGAGIRETTAALGEVAKQLRGSA